MDWQGTNGSNTMDSFAGGYVPFYEPIPGDSSIDNIPADQFGNIPTYFGYDDKTEDEEDDEYYFQQQDEAESRAQQSAFDTTVG
jgi:hypothetical protein